MPHVFVYGTLKRGYPNNSILLRNAKFLGPAVSVQPVYKMETQGFPAIWEVGEAGNFVRGELYEVSEEQLARCDNLEGHPHMYCRQARTFRLPNDRDRVMSAWVYLWNNKYGRFQGEPVLPENGHLSWDRPHMREPQLEREDSE